MERFPPQTPDEHILADLVHPVLIGMLAVARQTAESSGGAKEFPEYGEDGDVDLSVLDADLQDLEYVLPGAFQFPEPRLAFLTSGRFCVIFAVSRAVFCSNVT